MSKGKYYPPHPLKYHCTECPMRFTDEPRLKVHTDLHRRRKLLETIELPPVKSPILPPSKKELLKSSATTAPAPMPTPTCSTFCAPCKERFSNRADFEYHLLNSSAHIRNKKEFPPLPKKKKNINTQKPKPIPEPSTPYFSPTDPSLLIIPNMDWLKSPNPIGPLGLDTTIQPLFRGYTSCGQGQSSGTTNNPLAIGEKTPKTYIVHNTDLNSGVTYGSIVSFGPGASDTSNFRSFEGEPPRPVCCKPCNRIFTNQSYLDSHLRFSAMHNVPCPICPEKFETRSDYKLHMDQAHPEEEPQMPICCKPCNRTFTNQSYLDLHLKAAPEHNPILCPICPEKFKTRLDYKLHMDQAHPDNTSDDYAKFELENSIKINRKRRASCDESEDNGYYLDYQTDYENIVKRLDFSVPDRSVNTETECKIEFDASGGQNAENLNQNFENEDQNSIEFNYDDAEYKVGAGSGVIGGQNLGNEDQNSNEFNYEADELDGEEEQEMDMRIMTQKCQIFAFSGCTEEEDVLIPPEVDVQVKKEVEETDVFPIINYL